MSSQSGLPADASSASFSCTDGTGDYWNNWQDLARGEWVDWGDHPTIRALLQNRLFGSPEIDLFTHLLQSYPEFASASALSLCCGDGSFEKALLQAGVFTHVTGIDIAERRIASAAENDDDRFTCRLGDVNRGAFGTAVYDVVLAKSALHHIQSLEAAFAGMDRCLRPDGYLLTIDYFGPDRLQWTDRQLFEANRFLSEEIPPELRRFGADGQYDQVANPSAEEVIAADPSEAARSSELLGFVDRHFEVKARLALGGTLLGLIFTGAIVNNFRPDNPAHTRIIQRAFQREWQLIDDGELTSDFQFIVAKKRADGQVGSNADRSR